MAVNVDQIFPPPCRGWDGFFQFHLKTFFIPAVFLCAISASLCAQTLTITSAPYNASTASVDNAAAIQAAINAVGSGGTVVVPAGTFLSGPITLKSNMTFQLASGAILRMLPRVSSGGKIGRAH